MAPTDDKGTHMGQQFPHDGGPYGHQPAPAPSGGRSNTLVIVVIAILAMALMGVVALQFLGDDDGEPATEDEPEFVLDDPTTSADTDTGADTAPPAAVPDSGPPYEDYVAHDVQATAVAQGFAPFVPEGFNLTFEYPSAYGPTVAQYGTGEDDRFGQLIIGTDQCTEGDFTGPETCLQVVRRYGASEDVPTQETFEDRLARLRESGATCERDDIRDFTAGEFSGVEVERTNCREEETGEITSVGSYRVTVRLDDGGFLEAVVRSGSPIEDRDRAAVARTIATARVTS